MNIPMRRPDRQRGFSLIELMVAMVVSLILILGIVSLLLANKASYRTETEFAALQQNARLARFVLKNAISHAGYLEDLTTKPQHAFPAGGFISDEKDPGRSDYDNDSDSITIGFQSDGDMNDCLGNPVGTSGALETVHFELFVDAENELQCIVYDSNPRAVALVSNVVLMQVLYGLDTTPGDANRGVDRYTTKLTASARDQVRSVRVQLVLTSASKLRTTPLQVGFDIAGHAKTFLPGQAFEPGTPVNAAAGAPPDPTYHAYVMVDQVIALRNLLP